MPRRLHRAVICVLALGAAASLTLGGTVSAYTDTESTASNAFTAAADWTAPTAAAAPIGRSTAYDTGFIDQGKTYFVYANVATQSFTTVIDNTAPAAADMQSTNVSGGTVGRFDLGDRLTLTYGATMDPYSILAAWTASATTAAMTWTPSTSATEIAGNASTATTATQSGAAHVNF